MSLATEHSESSWGKRPPPKKSEPEATENTAKAQPQAKPDNAPKPSAPSPRSEAKKPADVPPKKASSPQVNALVARLPLLLPRVQPRDCLLVSPGTAAVHSPHPILAPKLTPTPVGGTVKMALSVGAPPSTLLASAVNGPTGLVSQPAAVPVINMVPVINVAVPPAAENRPKPKSISSGAGGASSVEAERSPCEPQKVKSPTKRPADRLREVTAKRKRGRPRKKLDDPPVQENSILRKELSKSKEDSDPVVVPAASKDPPAAPTSPHQNLTKGSSQAEGPLELEVKRPAPEQLMEERPAPEQLMEERPAPEQLMEERPAPEQLMEERPAPEQLMEERPAPEQLMEERPAPEQLMEERPAPKQLMEERPAPKQLMEERPPPEQLMEERPAPEQLREERPAEARNVIVALPRRISPYHLSVIRTTVPRPLIPMPFGWSSQDSPPLDQPDWYNSYDPDLQPTDLSMKSRRSLSMDCPTTSGLWTPAGHLQQIGTDHEKSTEAASSSEATRQGPS